MTEEWRPVVGWEGLYEVSNHGRVKGYRNKILDPKPSKSTGYKSVVLSRKGSKERRSIHRMVAESFLPNPDSYPLVRHLNDVKIDNRLENLSWGTYVDNGLDSVINGGHRMFSVLGCPHGHTYDEENTRINPLGRRECRVCRKAWLNKSSKKMAERGIPLGDHRHGTYAGYRHYKCRCDKCKQARREYAQDLARRKRGSFN